MEKSCARNVIDMNYIDLQVPFWALVNSFMLSRQPTIKKEDEKEK